MSLTFRCPGCGEERLVDLERETWACRVCGQQGPRRTSLRLLPGTPSAKRAADQLPALIAAVVEHRFGPGVWQVAAIAPLTQWSPAVQRELTAAVSAGPESVVLVLERVPS